MITEKKASAFAFKALSDDGTFEGYGSIFGNVDLYGDIVAKGAFRKTLAEAKKTKRMPRLLMHHDSRMIAGVYDEMHEDDTGLFVKGRFNLEKQLGKEAHSDAKMGAIDGLSIGYVPRKTKRDEDTGVRTIVELDLWEVSLVVFPANPDARVGAVKSIAAQVKTIRDFEEHLRDAGFSAAAAKSIAARGFRADLRDEAADAETRALRSLASIINR